MARRGGRALGTGPTLSLSSRSPSCDVYDRNNPTTCSHSGEEDLGGRARHASCPELSLGTGVIRDCARKDSEMCGSSRGWGGSLGGGSCPAAGLRGCLYSPHPHTCTHTRTHTGT